MELCGNGTQANECHAFVRRLFHRSARVQSHNCVIPFALCSLTLCSLSFNCSLYLHLFICGYQILLYVFFSNFANFSLHFLLSHLTIKQLEFFWQYNIFHEVNKEIVYIIILLLFLGKFYRKSKNKI